MTCTSPLPYHLALAKLLPPGARHASNTTASAPPLHPLLHFSPSSSPSLGRGSPMMQNQTGTRMASLTAPTGDSAAGRRKGARGPGKKEPRDKPIVSVRWEEGDLTDRLISCILNNERWSAVFAQAPGPGGDTHVRLGLPGVPKRDLHREISRHLFATDPRYDLEDRRVLEALAVSVKNKLFKIQTLYNECKQEMGDLANLSEAQMQQATPEQTLIWSHVREKFSQFFRVRDILARLPLMQPKEDPDSPDDGRSAHGFAGQGQFQLSNPRGLKRPARPSFEDMPAAAGPRSTTYPGYARAPTHATRGSPARHPLPDFLSPSPPVEGPALSETLSNLILQLDARIRDEKRRKDRDRQRWFEREMQDRERQREHEKEMMEMRIRLARAEHGGEGTSSGGQVMEDIEEEDGSQDAEGERDDTYLPLGDERMG